MKRQREQSLAPTRDVSGTVVAAILGAVAALTVGVAVWALWQIATGRV